MHNITTITVISRLLKQHSEDKAQGTSLFIFDLLCYTSIYSTHLLKTFNISFGRHQITDKYSTKIQQNVSAEHKNSLVHIKTYSSVEKKSIFCRCHKI